MSNPVFIETCSFVSTNNEVTYGYLIYDYYAKTFGNHWETELVDPIEILKQIISEASQIEREIFDSVKLNEGGISINGNYMDWDEIKDCFQ